MKNPVLISILACVAAMPAWSQGQIPQEQLDKFFSRVPHYGEPARRAAQNEALRERYERQKEIAEANGYRVRAQARAAQHQGTIDAWGEPDTHYSNGGYERRTYRRDGKIYGITTQDGEITDFSTYDTGR